MAERLATAACRRFESCAEQISELQVVVPVCLCMRAKMFVIALTIQEKILESKS